MYQVSFSSKEMAKDSFHVPPERAVKISEDRMALKFVSPNKRRCQSLQGTIGQMVGCQIYDRRPSPCRNFKASYEDGQKNIRCDEARATMGLAPLTREDWVYLKQNNSIENNY